MNIVRKIKDLGGFIMSEHNKMVLDAWIAGRINLTCMLASFEKEEEVILDAVIK